MAEKPILFSGDMVGAILAGLKTQTRRVIKPQSENTWEKRSGDSVVADILDSDGSWRQIRCPYGKPGDTLWVREAWRVGAWSVDDGICVDYRADNYSRGEWLQVPDEQFERLWVDSTDDAIEAGLKPDENGMYKWLLGQAPTRWRPSIYMPRWASRLKLKIVDIRVQRIHAVTYEDVVAEGVDYIDGIHEDYWVEPWAKLWDSINAKRGYSFDSNPWIWVVEFERVDR